MYEEIVKQLAEFMKLFGKSQQQVAKEAGVSTSVISQFLKGTYRGNNEDVAETIGKYLEIAKLREAGTSHVKFFEGLGNTREVLFACRYAHIHSDMALIYGDAGAGKTTALEYYAENNIGVIMVTANSCTSSAASILQLISRKIGKPVSGKKEALMSTLVSYFRGTGRLIVIDEADHLTLSALQAIRNLNDEAHVGIVLSGNKKIYFQMIQGSKCMELEQLRTRIVVRRCVQNNYTLEEFRSIFPGVADNCLIYLLRLAADESMRTAIKTLEIAYDYKQQVDLEALKMVRGMLTEEPEK